MIDSTRVRARPYISHLLIVTSHVSTGVHERKESGLGGARGSIPASYIYQAKQYTRKMDTKNKTKMRPPHTLEGEFRSIFFSRQWGGYAYKNKKKKEKAPSRATRLRTDISTKKKSKPPIVPLRVLPGRLHADLLIGW